MNDKQERAFREALHAFINSMECMRVSKDGIASGSWVTAKLEKLKELMTTVCPAVGEEGPESFSARIGVQPEKEWPRPPKVVTPERPGFHIDAMIDAFMADKPEDWNGRFFFLMIVRMVETFIKKNTDYAGLDNQKLDMLANFRESESIGVPMLKGILVRSGDKWMRIKNLTREDRKGMVKDEAVVDTMLDLANYMLIAIVAHMSTVE